jgi:MFS family permease
MQHTKRTLYQRWARRLIACYPTCWRQRYAEEMLLILEDSQITLKTMLNLFMHLFDAYLHQYLVKERTPSMLQKMRSNELTIYGATVIFFVAWFVVQVHFVDFVPGHPRVLSAGFSYTPSLLVNIIHSVSYLLPLFILLGGLPILLAAIFQALKERKVRTLLFCLLSLISPLVTGIAAIMLSSIWWLTPFSVIIGLGISLAFITFSVERVTPSRRITHYALSLATLIPLVMLVGLGTLLLRVIPPLVTLFLAGDSTVYILLILIMVGALFLSLLCLQRGFQARRTMQETPA